MQSSGIPVKFNIPWGNAAVVPYIRPIPQASQIGIQAGAASLTDGFPPLTFTPVGAGGADPWGADFNGILNQISAWSRWFHAGGPVKYDATFQAAVGGYPLGAIVASATTFGRLWISSTENNVTNPDASGAGWLLYPVGTGQANTVFRFTTPGAISYTPTAGAVRARGRMIGAGGGGGARTLNVAATSGGDTLFGTTGLAAQWQAKGGTAGNPGNAAAGAGGDGGPGGNGGNNGTGTLVDRSSGADGHSCNPFSDPTSDTQGQWTGGPGGVSRFAGGGAPTRTGGGSAKPNTGSGGAGGTGTSSGAARAGGGGGAGEFVEFWIMLAGISSISGTVGAKGTGGTAGGSAGGDGSDGIIIIEEFYL